MLMRNNQRISGHADPIDFCYFTEKRTNHVISPGVIVPDCVMNETKKGLDQNDAQVNALLPNEGPTRGENS